MSINRQIAGTLRDAGVVWPLVLLLTGVLLLSLYVVMRFSEAGLVGDQYQWVLFTAALMVVAGLMISAWQLHTRLLRPLIMRL